MKFENVEIDELGNLKNKLCPYNVSTRLCGDWCPHFGKPEEIILTKRLQPNHILDEFRYTHENTGLYTLNICHGTKIKLGKIVM